MTYQKAAVLAEAEIGPITKEAHIAARDSAIPVAVLYYDPEAPDGCEMSVRLSELSVGFLATLTDFELKVIAAEAGLRMRRALEIPPSPDKQTS